MSNLQLFDGLSTFADNQTRLSCRDDHLLHGTRLAIGHLVTPRHNVVDERLGSPENRSRVFERVKTHNVTQNVFTGGLDCSIRQALCSAQAYPMASGDPVRETLLSGRPALSAKTMQTCFNYRACKEAILFDGLSVSMVLTMGNLNLAARVLLYFVDLFTSSANDCRKEIYTFFFSTSIISQYRILVAMHVLVLTEPNHAVRHTTLFRHC